MRFAGILTVLLLVLGASPPCHGASAAIHNITDILAAYPNFTDFSAALTSTGAAAEIDGRRTITVLALDNAAMAQLRAQHLHQDDLERVTYLHALVDYFDAGKLRSIRGGAADSTSLFQAVGKARADEGMVKITVSAGGRVAFALASGAGASNAAEAAVFMKSVKEVPYDIAVLQVSAPIWSPAPVAASPPPPAALAPLPGSSPATAPAAAPAHAPPRAPSPASSPAADAPTPARAPAVAPAPAIPPTPRRRPAPAPEAETPVASPDADSNTPADDQKSNGAARDTASWSLVTAVAVAVPVILLLLW